MNPARIIHTAGRIPGLRSLLRFYARLYREGSIVRIRSGAARGMRWKRHHRYVNGYWLGQYELPIQGALTRELRPGSRFFDIGANAGFFTLVAARRVESRGQCIAFDPLPENCDSIAEQIEINRLKNCKVTQEAVSDFCGSARFAFDRPGSSTGHLGGMNALERELEVKVMTLDSAAERFGEPDFIKLDIEGAEGAALRGGARVVEEIRPTWLIEIHSEDCEMEVKRILTADRYSFFSLENAPLNIGKRLPNHVVVKPRGPK